MPWGCQTLPEIQWTVVWLLSFLDHEQIGMGVNLSIWMVKHILSQYCDYGTIPNPGSDVVVEKEWTSANVELALTALKCT